ncbi:transposase [Streptomyces roseolus]|uniref:transposase n=1 Tax=Streptomyces roseolus TaxID=67358 RepID=UPI0037A300F7
MIRRHELSDAEWEFVRPLLPESVRGRKRLEDRRVLNGVVWKFRTGTAWRDAAGDIDWLVSVDSTVVRAHQHAAGARKGAPQPGPRPVQRRTDQQDPPGLRRQRPSLAFVVTDGNTDDCTRFITVMETIWVPRLGPGRPRVRPDHVLGDKGYSSRAIRT